MPETNINNIDNPQPDDARRLSEDIASGEQQVSNVDVSSDYEAAKAYSQSDLSKSEAGAEAAEAATGPKLEVPQPEEQAMTSESSADPEDYRAMAKEVNPGASSAKNVDDNMMKQAVDKGQPGQS